MAEKAQEMAQIMDHLLPHEVFRIGPLVVTSTVVNTWIMMALLAVLVFLFTRRLQERPKGAQSLLEVVMDFLNGLIDNVAGHQGRIALPLVGTVFIFILFLNLAWFVPELVPPTSDFNTPLALAITDLVLVNLFAIRLVGFRRWVKRFIEPTPIMLPMNILEWLVRGFSLTVRLFGNIFGGKTVVTILFILLPFVAPTPVMLLEVLFGFIQAFVFTLLTVVYLAETVGHH